MEGTQLMGDTRIVIREHELREMLRSREMGDQLVAVGTEIGRDAAARAPHDTGAGAASIHAEAVLSHEGFAAHISWTRDRYYMGFHERGTINLPARPFLIPAVEARSR